MPTNLTDTDEWHDEIPVPAGGDQVSRADLVEAMRRINDRVVWLAERAGFENGERRVIVPASAFGIGDGASLIYGPSYGIAGPSVELVAGGVADLSLSSMMPGGTRIKSVRVFGFAGNAADELKVQRIVYPTDPGSADAPGYTKDLLTVTGPLGAFDEEWEHVTTSWDTVPWHDADYVFRADRGSTILRLLADPGNVSGTAVHGLDILFQWAP